MASPTAEEQYLLELINETRMDPAKAAMRYLTSYSPLQSNDPAIQDAIVFFSVNGPALQAAYATLVPVAPVAWNAALADAATKHNDKMILAGVQSHQLPGEASIGERILAEGYNYRQAGENVYAFAQSLLYAHAGFMIDWGVGPNGMQNPAGHRITIMNAAYTEVGIEVKAETTTTNPTGPLVITQEFATVGNLFVLGVAYNDSNADKFYSVGEGVAGLRIAQSTGGSATTEAAGGYSLQTSNGAKTFTLSGGGLASEVTVSTTINNANLKLDVVNGNTLLTSGSVSVSGPISFIRGLGTKGLLITAGAGNQTIVGTSATDVLNGGAGNDLIEGGQGNDTIDGGDGIDYGVLPGKHTDYNFSGANGGLTWILTDAVLGVDAYTNIEAIRFSDGLYAWNFNLARLTAYTPPSGTVVGGAAANNNAPTVSATQAVTTQANTAKQVTVTASDQDGDTLSFAVGTARNGTIVNLGGGVFTYTPKTAFTGPDSFVVTISDGQGGTSTQTVSITVNPIGLNHAPTVPASQAVLTAVGVSKQFTVIASDQDGDALTFTLGAATNGTVTGSNGVYTYTPRAGFNGSDTVRVTVSDGLGGTAFQTVNFTVNAQPTVSGTQTVSTSVNNGKQIAVRGSDPDGDNLTYNATNPAHGTVTGGIGGLFNYTPTAGYVGTDGFSVTVSDGKGGSATQTVAINVLAGSSSGNGASFRLFISEGFTGEVGGNGSIFGSNGVEDIEILPNLGDITFDTSFNRGGDVLRFQGTAGSWQISSNGATVTLSRDGDVHVFPAGTAGVQLNFDDGIRLLQIDPASGSVKIGSQTVSAAPAAILAAAISTDPTQDATLSIGRMFLNSGAEVTIGGDFSLTGTSDAERVNYNYGRVTLDPSFNRGNDVVTIEETMGNMGAYIAGSSVVLVSSLGTLTVPFGPTGMTLDFDGTQQVLRYDVALGAVFIGNVKIDSSLASAPTPLGGGSGGGPAVNGSADLGTASSTATLTLDANKTYTLTEDANITSFVNIVNFNNGDKIKVTGAAANAYNFGTGDADFDGSVDDLIMTYSNGANVNQTALLNVIVEGSFVYDELSAEVVLGWNFVSFG